MPRARKKKRNDSLTGEATPIAPVIEELARKYDLVPASEIPDPSLPDFDDKWAGRNASARLPIPDEALPAFPVKLRERFPPLPEGFDARGTFDAAGIRVTRHGDGSTATQFKDGHAMSFAEKLAFEDRGNRYVPRDKQWANPASTWEEKLVDARAMAEARLADRER